ncbi:membrane protein insertase YidC [Streptomyces sp. NPDC059740]|uniref:membrane protein insertase YidC n=1 Tax=Streptomyces sp. NPDC059740 TaxID=3346926 RepID=UPI00365A8ABE
MSPFSFLGDLLSRLADLLAPLCGASATAAAVVTLTLAVRAALHPLARAAARGDAARAAFAPRLAELRRTHRDHPERLQRAVTELYAEAGGSPFTGCLPMLLQLPVFALMYHLFTGGGAHLGDHTLWGAPLGGHLTDAFAAAAPATAAWVYPLLFALTAAVATWNYRRARALAARTPAATDTAGQLPGLAGLARLTPLLSFATLVSVAVVPLAAALYLVTSTSWTACERAWLQQRYGKAGQDADQGVEAAEAEVMKAGAARSGGRK